MRAVCVCICTRMSKCVRACFLRVSVRREYNVDRVVVVDDDGGGCGVVDDDDDVDESDMMFCVYVGISE